MYQNGMSSRVSPLMRDLLNKDSRPLPAGLQMVGNHRPEARTIPFSRYTDPAFAKLEMERLWTKTWQYACRTEDIPNVGDRLPYDVGSDLSFIIVRSAPNEFKAFYNSCRHRGTRLVNVASSGDTIRCPYHGWQWKNDGALHTIPCQWDFEGATTAGSHSLREVKLATWQGFIFVNPDPAAGPLAETLGVSPEIFVGRNGYEDRYTIAHISKKVRANWKTTLEAFLESYHVLVTHFDSVPYVGDASTEYEIWETETGHVSRLITPNGVPSPHLGDNASAQDALDKAAKRYTPPGITAPVLDASKGDGRAQLAEWRRGIMGQTLGRDFSLYSDSEMLDATQYHIFPNFGPWLGEGLPLLYQFLPYGDNPNESVLNVRLTKPVPANGPRPSPAKITYLDFDEPFTGNAPEFGGSCNVFDQDFGNLPYVQKGMHTAAPDASQQTLGRYMEQRIQYFHNVLERVLGLM
jgi:phenylpropionate dioxygenase-like ring-hydroxylating dioxygenase large terminal subunit